MRTAYASALPATSRNTAASIAKTLRNRASWKLAVVANTLRVVNLSISTPLPLSPLRIPLINTIVETRILLRNADEDCSAFDYLTYSGAFRSTPYSSQMQ